MSTAGYVPCTAELDNVLDKFYYAFVDMLVGKTKGHFVDKADMYKVLQTSVSLLFLFTQCSTHDIVSLQTNINHELAKCDVDTPSFDTLLKELKKMKLLFDNPLGHVPSKDFLCLADMHIAPSILCKLQTPPKDIELVTSRGKTQPRKSSSKPATTQAPSSNSSKPPAIAKPAAKADVVKASPKVKHNDEPDHTKIQPQPIKKKIVTYIDINASDKSSIEEEEEDAEEESGEDDKEVIEVAKKTRRKPVKSPAIITDDMDDDASGKKNDDTSGKKKRTEWSAADRTQTALDAEWSFQDRGDPCLVEDKDFWYGPLYWGSYSTPLARLVAATFII